MASYIDESQQFIGIVQPLLHRHQTLLAIRFALGIKTDYVVTSALCRSSHKFVLVSEYFLTSVSLSVVLFSTFKHTE